MNLIHLFIPLIALASLDYPLESAYPVAYTGVSNSSDGYAQVNPDEELGLSAGYGYVVDDIGTVSTNLRCYDYFAFLYDQYHGNVGITSTAGSGFSYLSNSSYLTLTNDNVVSSKASGGLPSFAGSVDMTSIHLIVPDVEHTYSFSVSLAVGGGYNSTSYWQHRLIALDDLAVWETQIENIDNIQWADLVHSGHTQYDYTNINVSHGYAIVFFHVYPGVVNNGSPYYYGYEVDSLTPIIGSQPEDWGAENLLTLFGYLFVGISAIFSIVIFPGLTLGVIILFPLALGVLALVYKILGS